jgi:hypothetical protein
LKSSIEVLQLPLLARFDLFISAHFSNLRTLILEEDEDPDGALISQFWKNHDKLERIELGSDVTGEGWFSGMQPGWLPNLQTLKVKTYFMNTSQLIHGLTVHILPRQSASSQLALPAHQLGTHQHHKCTSPLAPPSYRTGHDAQTSEPWYTT